MYRKLLVIVALGLPACGTSAVPAPQTVSAAEPPSRERQWLFDQGLEAARRGDSVRAEQYLSLSRERGYPEDKVLPALLKVCLASSRLRAALDYAEPYLRKHPEQDALRFLVVSIHVGLGQRAEALTELARLTKHNPRFADAYFLRATLVVEEDEAAAAEALRTYLSLEPRGAQAAEARSRLSELAPVKTALRRRAGGG